VELSNAIPIPPQIQEPETNVQIQKLTPPEQIESSKIGIDNPISPRSSTNGPSSYVWEPKHSTTRDSNEREYALTDFTSISLQGIAEVMITQGPFKVTAWGEDEAMEHLVIKVVKNNLIITSDKEKYKKKQKKKHTVNVRISMPTLSAVNISGFGNVTTSSFDNLENFGLDLSGFGNFGVEGDLTVSGKTLVRLSGFGNVTLKGSSSEFDVALSGFGNVEAPYFKTTKCAVDLSGYGNAQVHCDGEISIDLTGFGDIKYDGNASVSHQSKKGHGTISH